MEPLLLTVAETKQVLRLGHSKVYELIAAGELPSIKIGKARRIPMDAIKRLIAERSVEPNQTADVMREGEE